MNTQPTAQEIVKMLAEFYKETPSDIPDWQLMKLNKLIEVAKSYVPSPSGQSVEDWQPIFNAPKDGTEIWIGYYSKDGITDECVARWSERPVCMLGDRNGGFPPGWATAGDDTDKNLPVDPPQYWKPLEGAKWALSQSPQIDEYIIDFIEWAVKQSETVRMQNADPPQDIYQLYLNDKNKQ